VVVTDLVDETISRPKTFFENQGLGVVRQWPVMCPSVSAALGNALSEEQCRYSPQGVYVCIEGPRRETPAEARKFAMYGGELLGMTLAPEVFLAKELQMCYAGISYVAGDAESGSDFQPFENGRILDREKQELRALAAVEKLPRVVERLVDVLRRTPSMCACESSMQHHIARGQIGMDWRTWFDRERPTQTAAMDDVSLPVFPASFAPSFRRPAASMRSPLLYYEYPYEDSAQP
jgi:5'-methylthioadenosine phosphorylase